MPIFTSRIYIYNIYHCQEWIYYYLDISILKSTILEIWKTKIGLRHTYERVYNNDVFGESNTSRNLIYPLWTSGSLIYFILATRTPERKEAFSARSDIVEIF